MKVRELLRDGVGRYILKKVMGKDIPWLYLYEDMDAPLKAVKYYKMVKEEGYPVEYLFNEVEFYGERFCIREGVLIPRDETEVVLEECFKVIRRNRWIKKVVDVGTGSGVLAILIKKEFPHLEVIGTDISPTAIEVATQNSKLHGVEVQFKLVQFFDEKGVDLVVSNPPYLEKRHPLPNRFEPPEAFYGGGEEGLDTTLQLLQKCNDYGVKGAVIEISPYQKERLYRWLKEKKWVVDYYFFKDYLPVWRGVVVSLSPLLQLPPHSGRR
jgi:release factor glutamine methyltransferase